MPALRVEGLRECREKDMGPLVAGSFWAGQSDRRHIARCSVTVVVVEVTETLWSRCQSTSTRHRRALLSPMCRVATALARDIRLQWNLGVVSFTFQRCRFGVGLAFSFHAEVFEERLLVSGSRLDGMKKSK